MRAGYDNPHDDRITKTCRGCGAEKSIREFPWRTAGNCYHARCYDCKNRAQREWARSRYQPRPRSRIFWTPEQDAALLAAITEGRNPDEAAAATGRSVHAVSSRRKNLNLPKFRARKRTPGPVAHWPPERVAQLAGLRAAGHSYRGCARLLGCTRSAIASAVKRFLKETRHDHTLPDLRQSGAADRDQGLPDQQHAAASRHGHQAEAAAG